MVLLHLLTLGFCQGKLSIICQMSGPTYHQVSHIHRNMSVGSLGHLLFSYHMIDKEQYAIYLSPNKRRQPQFYDVLGQLDTRPRER